MKDGFQVSFSFSEFVAAAAFISITACTVGYFYTHRPEPAPVQAVAPACSKEPLVIIQQMPAPEIKVIIPQPRSLPKVDDPEPDPAPQQEKGKQPFVWDNDNMLSASTPLMNRTLKRGDR